MNVRLTETRLMCWRDSVPKELTISPTIPTKTQMYQKTP